MKICVVALATFEQMAGGSARHVSGLVGTLRQAGHEVTVLTSTALLPERRFFGQGTLGQVTRSLIRVSVVSPAVSLIVARQRPDVVNIHFPLDGLGAVLGARIAKVPCVVTFHGPWAGEALATGVRGRVPFSTGLRRAIERFVYRQAERCICLSTAFADVLVEGYGVQRERIIVVPGAIEPARFPLIARAAARARLGLPDSPTVVTVRRLVPRVGLDLAIEALATIPIGRRPRLVIGGSGPERAALEGLAKRLGVDDAVHFFGHVPEDQLADFYAAGDMCVVPSRELEGFGYVALEAFAAGTPVVAVTTGGLVDLVGGLEPRWLVPWDAAALAAAMTELLDTPENFPSREECRSYAARFGWHEIAARTVAVYAEAARSSSKLAS